MNRRPGRTTDDKIAEAADWCIQIADGELREAQRARLDLWLAADPDHVRLLEDAVAAWGETGDQASAPEMIALRHEALADVWRAKERRRIQHVGLKVAAGLAAAAALGLGLSQFPGFQPPATYVTNVGERRVVALPDGSKVSLDAQTSVRVRYTGDRRQFWLDHGRAKFDVARNPIRPFTVAASGKTVVATGTQFSVEILQSQVRVDLFEGHVAILAEPAHTRLASNAEQTDPATTRYLAPGEEFVASGAGDKGLVRRLGQGDAPSWEGGQLVFVDEPLATVAERANRYSDRKIIVADPLTGRQRISGVFTAGDTAAIVTAVTAILPVRAAESQIGVRLALTRPEISQPDGARSGS